MKVSRLLRAGRAVQSILGWYRWARRVPFGYLDSLSFVGQHLAYRHLAVSEVAIGQLGQCRRSEAAGTTLQRRREAQWPPRLRPYLLPGGCFGPWHRRRQMGEQ